MKRKPNPNAILAVGVAIGAGLGVVFHHIALYVVVGICLGLAMRAIVKRGLDR